MKRYQEYMDSVEVPSGLHERLTGLTAPKKAVPWKKCGAMAAALVLAVGAGSFGLSRLPATGAPAIGTAELGQPVPSMALVEPGTDSIIDETHQTGGGYELPGEDGRLTAYFMLPAIIYNEGGNATAADYSLAPPGALSRDAGLDDVAALVGGQEAMKLHLLWGGELEWSGTLWFLEDGAPCAANLWASGDGVELNVEIMAGSEVPSCVIFPDEYYETTTFLGVDITALKNMGYAVKDDGTELRESRRLSCFADGVGYKLTIYGVDGELVENMCARFVRWAVVEGFDLSVLSVDGAAPVDTAPAESVGEPNWEDGAVSPSQGPANGADTPAHDPAASQTPGTAPVPNAPAPSAAFGEGAEIPIPEG